MEENLQELANSLSLLERKVLPHLKDRILLEDLIDSSKLQEVEIRRALLWLGNRNIAITEIASEKIVQLFTNGELAHRFDLPEFRILKELQTSSKTPQEISSDTLPINEIMSAIGNLKSKNAIIVTKKENQLELSLTEAGKHMLSTQSPEQKIIKKQFPLKLLELSSDEKRIIEDLQKRKDFLKVIDKKITTINLTPLGKKLTQAKLDLTNIEEKLTSDLLKSGEWKNKIFRTYDIQSPVPEISGARRHPVTEVHNLIKNVFLSMGFKEMDGPLVESAFWCMDSMWIPQDHPARDVQDTFYVDGKATLPEQFVKSVKAVHENGGNTGSTGYGKPWDEEKAKQLILRTHSTAATFRKFGEGINEDCKYFYIATNFRNEATDATHLAEFVQVEGFVMGDNLGLPHLMGMIKEFFEGFGITKIRFKPTYNPYTEPSMEAHYYDEKKKKWYALINSGIFRPESLAPYGIKKSVIAWGMGGTRVAALLNNIMPKDMVGAEVNFDWISKHKTPQPRLD
ncbi:MAG: phenylalanine--tRNA ligase subunit alpha [Candidatus Nanoarchaeia archaeon]|nr:phenylalanine--tRNA ligase subunit alpha [Candidatus Nanoarchaeia archaeon]